MELCRYIQKNYYQLNAPLIIKSGSKKTKESQRDLKHFQRACFHLIERKILSLDSEFLLIQNDQLENELNLGKKDILILRNDILSKYNDCQITGEGENARLVPQLTLEPYRDPQSLINFIKGKTETFESWKTSNMQLVNKLAVEKSQYQSFLNTFQAFALPRVIFLQSSRRSDVASLLKKFHLTRDEEYYALSLQLSQNSPQENHLRLINFFRLQKELQNEKIVFFEQISSSSGLDDMFPHLNENNSSFVLFNLFRQIDLGPNIFKTPIYKRLSHSYEKYLITDLQNLTEDYSLMKTKIQTILQTPLDQRINQIDLISTDFDKIRRINGAALQKLLEQQSKTTKIIHVYTPGLIGNFVRKTLIDLTIHHNEIEFYQVSSENQINTTMDIKIKDGIFILHEEDIKSVKENLRNTVDNIIQKKSQ